nr:hypothetical protein [uncultured bacterium]
MTLKELRLVELAKKVIDGKKLSVNKINETLKYEFGEGFRKQNALRMMATAREEPQQTNRQKYTPTKYRDEEYIPETVKFIVLTIKSKKPVDNNFIDILNFYDSLKSQNLRVTKKQLKKEIEQLEEDGLASAYYEISVLFSEKKEDAIKSMSLEEQQQFFYGSKYFKSNDIKGIVSFILSAKIVLDNIDIVEPVMAIQSVLNKKLY